MASWDLKMALAIVDRVGGEGMNPDPFGRGVLGLSITVSVLCREASL